MNNLISICLTILSLTTFCNTIDAAKVVLFAEGISYEDENFETFTLFADSIYVFNSNYKEWSHEKKEMFRGRYYIKADTIYFYPFSFRFIHSNKAVITADGIIEFLNGDNPLRMKIENTTLMLNPSYDTKRFKDYSFFSYNPKHYSHFDNKVVKPTKVDNNDLIKIDSLLVACMMENSFRRKLE